MVLTVLCGLALVLSFFNLHPWVPYFAVAFGAYFAIRSAWDSIASRQVDVNILMVLAAVGAIAVGEPRDAAALLFLFSLSSTLEALALGRTKSAIEGLIKLRPSQALRVLNGQEQKVAVEELQKGDLVKIPPFEPVPVDGTVVEGRSSLDQSAMTGESVPVEKATGDRLLAGTNNLEGVLIMSVETTVGNSTLDRMVELVSDAQDNKASGEKISTWFGQRYTIFVLVVFVIAFAVRMLAGGALQEALYRSITLLVALSPCALVISTPATTLSALAWAARNGILIRGGGFIEQAGNTQILALDKTGTLTTGRPKLHEICVCAGAEVKVGGGNVACEDEHACWREGKSMSPEALELLAAAAVAEAYSQHPIALAVLQAARDHGVTVPEGRDHTASPGLGVGAIMGGRRVLIGQRRYLETEGIHLPADFVEHLEDLQRQGMTVAVMAHGERLAALGFVDTPRVGARQFLEDAKAAGVKRFSMLTGDTQQTAGWVASNLGIADYKAGLLPDEKTAAVEQLTKEGTVMMVGDGINDAPSLARANVGVAMGGLGSDIAMNAADVVLMHDKLERIPELIRLGKKTNGVIRANLLFATGVIVVLTISSFVIDLPLPIAVIGHEGSTVLVILNGLRLLRGPGS
jgi:Cd2+/Zn2+-exporting ATPase